MTKLNTKPIALITGISGQDGSYLAEFLLEKNYHVVGFGRKESLTKSNLIHPIRHSIEFVYGNLGDYASIYEAIHKIKPNEVYNLASQSHPGESWNLAIETAEITGLGAHRLFDAVRQIKPDCRIYQASSSEMYGEIFQTPQNEQTAFNPVNPYAAAKLYVHNIAKIYRKSYQMFISCGILFNHESPRRGMHFITQKITYAAACIKLNIQNSLALNEEGEPIVKNGKVRIGNLDARRDWGHARDYTQAMWLMLQQQHADDFVIGSGQSHSIKDLCEIAFSHVGLNWQDHVVSDPRFVRPTETGSTIADARKAKSILGWQPQIQFRDLVAEMVDNHLVNLKC